MNMGNQVSNNKPPRGAAPQREWQCRLAKPALALALAGLAGSTWAQAVTSPVAAAPSTLVLPANNLGEAQIDYLLKAVQDLSRPNRGMPLEQFRERVLNAVQVHPDVLSTRATYAGSLETTRSLKPPGGRRS